MDGMRTTCDAWTPSHLPGLIAALQHRRGSAMRKSPSRHIAWAAMAILAAHAPASADPVTHEFHIASARTASRSDCGSGVCRPACQMTAMLRNVGSRAFPGMALEFGHPAPPTSNGESDNTASFSFRFPELQPGQAAEAARLQDGFLCGQIAVGRIRGVCLGDPSACRPGASVRIVGADMPAFETRTIEVDAPRSVAEVEGSD